MRQSLTREQKSTILYGILSVVVTLVVMQLWLLTATMNAYLGGDDAVLWAAGVASFVCFLLNAALLRHINNIDRDTEGPEALHGHDAASPPRHASN